MRIAQALSLPGHTWKKINDDSGIPKSMFIIGSPKETVPEDNESMIRTEFNVLLFRYMKRRNLFLKLFTPSYALTKNFAIAEKDTKSINWMPYLIAYQKELADNLTGPFAIRTRAIQLYIGHINTATVVAECSIYACNPDDYSYVKITVDPETEIWNKT